MNTYTPTYPALLRTLAELIEQHDLIEPYTIGSQRVGIHCYDSSARENIAAWCRALGGSEPWSNRDLGDRICLTRVCPELPGNPEVDLFIGKKSCTRTVVGQREVVVPAVKAAAAMVKFEDIVEWDCGPVLAGVNDA